jgi:hypothetical protein
MSAALQNSQVRVVNRDADPAIQEIYGAHSNTAPIVQRNDSTTNRSTSSIEMTCNASTAIEHAFEVLAKAGETIRLLLYVRKWATYGASTLPKATVSGLGITPVTATMSGATAADSWELLTLDATNAGASDGNLTVTLTAQSSTANAKAFFSGIPVAPFVTRCRHYGYQFNETSPTRTTDALNSASEATAAAYTGMAITWGASSSTAITTSNTFQKLYDYHQAQACLNVGSALALTGSGTAGSPSLFAAGNVAVSDGAVLNGSGSISMGSNVLSTEFADGINYTYTGGSWSQATTAPAFSGGTLTMATKVTTGGDFSMSDAEIVFGAVGADWSLSDAIFSGTITLSTTAGQAVTVAIPEGVTIDNTEPGNITVTAPVIVTNATATVLAGSRVQLYNVTTATEIENVVEAGTAYSYTITTEASDGDTLRLRVCKLGKLEQEEQAIFSATTGATFLISQPEDTTYTAWGIDGSTVTEYSLDGPNLQIDANDVDGNTLKVRLGAYYNYALTTEIGIRQFYGALTALSPAQLRVNDDVVDMYIDNTNATTPLIFTDTDVRLYKKSGATIIAPTSNSIHNDYSGVPDYTVVTVSGVNVITGDIADIPSAPTAVAVAGAVRTELSTELSRIDIPVSAVDGSFVVEAGKSRDELLRITAE